MFKGTKVRLICAIMAGFVFLSGFAFPTSVAARDMSRYFDDDDDDDYGDYWKYRYMMDNMSDDEKEDLRDAMVVAAIIQAAQEYEEEQERNRYVGVTGICVSSTDVSLLKGQAYQITGYVRPDNANNKGVTYYSTNPTVAWVEANGMIHANTPGICTVVSRSNENGYEAYTFVRVF